MSDNRLKTVLALGYFDSVHKGHRKVIEKAKQLANEQGATLTVFTFSGNLRAVISGKKEKQVYLREERAQIFNELGVNSVYFAPVNKKFLSMGKLAFLNMMNKKFNVIGYVCGNDYKFGKNGKGTVEYLKHYADKLNQQCLIVQDVFEDGERVSTSNIKVLLSKGEIKKANSMLVRPFSVTGVVIRDRQVGKEIGFPTLNLNISSEKVELLDGVYKGHCYVDGTVYKAMINYGSRPTFRLDDKLIEAHLLGFSGELYDKEITLFFDNFVRPVFRFDTVEQLKDRLKRDKLDIERGIYD